LQNDFLALQKDTDSKFRDYYKNSSDTKVDIDKKLSTNANFGTIRKLEERIYDLESRTTKLASNPTSPDKPLKSINRPQDNS